MPCRAGRPSQLLAPATEGITCALTRRCGDSKTWSHEKHLKLLSGYHRVQTARSRQINRPPKHLLSYLLSAPQRLGAWDLKAASDRSELGRILRFSVTVDGSVADGFSSQLRMDGDVQNPLRCSSDSSTLSEHEHGPERTALFEAFFPLKAQDCQVRVRQRT